MRFTGIALVWFGLCACGGVSDSAHNGDAAAPMASGQNKTPSACATDAGVEDLHSGLDGSPNDRRCPPAWTDLTDSAGIPKVCPAAGLVCAYPQGQADCEADGPDLKWWQNGLTTGCAEFPPASCQACASPGTTCEYIREPGLSAGDVFCCNGNSNQWQLQGTAAGFAGCPNGHVCGTIRAADYDQTCATDKDCAAINEGDLCTPGCHCLNATISARALTQYESDVTKKSNGTEAACPCPSGPNLACNSGVCGFAL